MNKIVLQTGNEYQIHDKEYVQYHKSLPIGTYIIKHSDFKGFYLEKVEDFVLPNKIYGKAAYNAERVLHTFNSRPLSTGVLMSGEKGAGKTLLAKKISRMGIGMDIPTLIINQPWTGDEFNAFIQSVEKEAILLFDEFEKVYNHDQQKKILTLLDGVFPTKKLFIITANNSWDISRYMVNRPGRMYYNFKFATLEKDFVIEYCNDNLKNKENIDEIVKYVEIFSLFNFDMLSSVVEEMNRYDEPMPEVLNYLNIEPEMKSNETYTISLVIDNSPYIVTDHYNDFEINKFRYNLYLYEIRKMEDQHKEVFRRVALAGRENPEDADDDDFNIYFDSKNLKEFNQADKEFVYEISAGNLSAELRVRRNERSDWKSDSAVFGFKGDNMIL